MDENLKTVFAILKNEVDGDVSAALEKMTSDYSMTWMYRSGNELFPISKPEVASEMREIYSITGRRYEIKNTAVGENVVMVELIESYPDEKSGVLHKTPLVLVLELQDGKIRTGRHYCDPKLSHENLSQEDLERAYQGTSSKRVIE